MVKGNLELIIYSFKDDQYYYQELNIPIIIHSASMFMIPDEPDIYLDVLLDAGEFIVPGWLIIQDKAHFGYRIEYNEWRIMKKKLPPWPILQYFSYNPVSSDKKTDDPNIAFHYRDSLLFTSLLIHGYHRKFTIDIEPEWIMHIQGDFYWNFIATKQIKYLPSPHDFNKKVSTVYDGVEMINRFEAKLM